MALRARSATADEAQAATRSVLGLTAGVGAMAAVTAAATGEPLAVVAVPTVVLLVLLRRTGPSSAAGYAAGAVWLAFLPHAGDEALLVPLVMASACLAIALGPDRLLRWIHDDFAGREDVGRPEQGIEDL